MATQPSVRYVMILEIEKIIEGTSSAWNVKTRQNENVEKRDKYNVARIVISDSGLNRLLERGTKHLELVQDEAMEIK